MQTEMLHIPLANIRENPVALRPVDKTTTEFAELVDSIKKHGVLNPINVREIAPAADGTKLYSVCDGLHRYTGANEAGLEKIPAQVISKTDAEVAEAQIIANFHKFETKHAQYAKQLNRIVLANPDLTMAELSGRLSMSVQTLTEKMSLVKLSENIQKLVDAGQIKLVNAIALAKMPPEIVGDFVERAMTQTAAEFVPAATAAAKKHRDDLRAGKTPGEATFEPVQLLQKLTDIKTTYSDCKSLAERLIALAQPKNPVEVFQLALAWVLRSDPESVKAQKDKWDAEKADAKAKKDAAAAERAKKKAEAAAAAALTV